MRIKQNVLIFLFEIFSTLIFIQELIIRYISDVEGGFAKRKIIFCLNTEARDSEFQFVAKKKERGGNVRYSSL